MDSEDREFGEVQMEEENEYCIVCHAVYAAAEGCWCVEPGATRETSWIASSLSVSLDHHEF